MVSRLAREILQAGLDDWVPLAAIESFARLGSQGDVGDDIREQSLQAIKELVLNGLAEIGEVSDGGFFECDQPLDDSLDRVREMCKRTDRNTWGFSLWVSNTPDGDQVAKRSGSGTCTPEG